MEDPWSSTFEQLSDRCRALRLDPSYSPDSCRDFSDDDDDPLGRPEITVKINDDWTISSNENLHAANENENSDEDEAEVPARDSIVIDSFLNDMSSLTQKDLTSDGEDQTVPSSAKRSCRTMLSEEFSLVVRDVDEEDAEGSDYTNEEEGEEEEQEEGEGKEEQDVSDKEFANKSDIGEVTADRSNPQPP